MKLIQEDKQPATALAKKLFSQVDGENIQCAFWVVSAIYKIAHENPKMSMICLRNIVRDNMPQAFEQYCEYLRTT